MIWGKHPSQKTSFSRGAMVSSASADAAFMSCAGVMKRMGTTPRKHTNNKLENHQFLIGDTPWTFNIAPEKLAPEYESSLPTIIFQGLCQISGVYIFSNGSFCPLAFVSFQGTVSFRTFSHVSFFDRRNVMKCCPRSLHFLLFISMDGGKFERQVASSKAYIEKQKDAFSGSQCIAASFRIFIEVRLHEDDDGFCLAGIYHSMLWIYFLWF